MKLVGYADPWSVAPGQTVRFHVSCAHPTYRSDIVRLRHGDARPGAPGLREERVPSAVEGERPGKAQGYPVGSHVFVPQNDGLRLTDGFTLAAWIFPTLPARAPQGILTRWSAASRAGYGLFIDERGALALRLGATDVSSGVPLRASSWYFVAASYDPAAGRIVLLQRPSPRWPIDPSDLVFEERVAGGLPTDSGGPFVMAGWWSGEGAAATAVGGHFDGRIEAPALYAAVLAPEVLERLAEGGRPEEAGPLAAAWDLALETPTEVVRDVSGNGREGRAINLPARGMSGHAFEGGEPAWMHAPETHGAIHFHSDDLDDCGWDVAFELTVPEDMPSGVYAARLTAGEDEDRIPFFVRPPAGRATAPILFLVPTNSYLAYANFREAFAQEHGVLGLYHFHADGSAVFYSSGRRPVVNLRPGSNFDVLAPRDKGGAPHQFSADLYLVDWLTEKGFPFDIATDRDLQDQGEALLSRYRVVLTGSHPEYWSNEMLDGLEAYLDSGGRFMYLGGNGLIWATSYDRARPHVVEVRRGQGNYRSAMPGDRHHSTTGELGGYWRLRGRAPHRFVGVGSIAQGFDRSSPYRRTDASFDPRAAWIFEGVGDDEPIGDFGLTLGGAAGFEIDSADESYGTPPHALVVASATELSPTYEHQNPVHIAGTDVDLSPPMRADMTYFETANGGAVFSVGSIAYCGALSHNGYRNNVSRITENVLRRFAELEER